MINEYETIPEKVKAFKAPLDMTVPATAQMSADGATDADKLNVKAGQWVVLRSIREVLDDEEFNKRYRIPVLPVLPIPPCTRPHSDYVLNPNHPFSVNPPGIRWGNS